MKRILILNVASYDNMTKRTILGYMSRPDDKSWEEYLAIVIKTNDLAIFPDTQIFVIEREYDAYALWKASEKVVLKKV